MRNFGFGAIMISSFFKHTIFVFELNFHNFQKKNLTLIRLLITTLLPLELTFFNSILA
jgi:hypothetical protein